MIQSLCKNWSVILLILLGGIVISNNVDCQQTTQKFNGNAPVVTFFYCYSCGYRKAFDEYQKILNEKFPELIVHGNNYDPPGMNLYLQRLILVAKFLLIGLIMSSYDIFAFLGMAQPTFWTWATENKLFAVMMTFFFGNMLEAQLMSTGAFEIILNDIPIWSKIATGRIPSPSELFSIIESHLQFTDNFFEKNPDFVK